MNEKIWLFDGSDTNGWKTRDGNPVNWAVSGDYMTVSSGNIISHEVYTDAHLHVEFACPDMPEATGQAKGNSGVFVHGAYEIQVLDSYGLEPSKWDCGAVYDCHAPLVNASLRRKNGRLTIYFSVRRAYLMKEQ